MQVALLFAANHDMFSLVFDCRFVVFSTRPWDAIFLREDNTGIT